jgi:hypothetical protein
MRNGQQIQTPASTAAVFNHSTSIDNVEGSMDILMSTMEESEDCAVSQSGANTFNNNSTSMITDSIDTDVVPTLPSPPNHIPTIVPVLAPLPTIPQQPLTHAIIACPISSKNLFALRSRLRQQNVQIRLIYLCSTTRMTVGPFNQLQHQQMSYYYGHYFQQHKYQEMTT